MAPASGRSRGRRPSPSPDARPRSRSLSNPTRPSRGRASSRGLGCRSARRGHWSSSFAQSRAFRNWNGIVWHIISPPRGSWSCRQCYDPQVSRLHTLLDLVVVWAERLHRRRTLPSEQDYARCERPVAKSLRSGPHLQQRPSVRCCGRLRNSASQPDEMYRNLDHHP